MRNIYVYVAVLATCLFVSTTYPRWGHQKQSDQREVSEEQLAKVSIYYRKHGPSIRLM